MTFTLNGLVLAGGKSSRMGTPKAMIDYHGIPQWKFCYQTLQTHCKSVFVSVSQHWELPESESGYATIEDVFAEPMGPLGGIVSALKKHSDCPWLVVACDMPYVTSSALQNLIENREPVKLATAYKNSQGLPEPLCAIYEPEILSVLLSSVAENRFCPRNILRSLDIKMVEAENDSIIANINHKHELTLLKKSVTIRYYAALREQRGLSEEIMETPSRTLVELYNRIRTQFGLSYERDKIRVAVNDHFVSFDKELNDGDRVMFLPPVAGG